MYCNNSYYYAQQSKHTNNDNKNYIIDDVRLHDREHHL